MELEIYDALMAANVPPDKARLAAESINREIDRRYTLHSQQLATRGDIAEVKSQMSAMRAELAEMKTEIIKWCIASILGSVGLFAAIVKVFQG